MVQTTAKVNRTVHCCMESVSTLLCGTIEGGSVSTLLYRTIEGSGSVPCCMGRGVGQYADKTLENSNEQRNLVGPYGDEKR